MFSTIPIGKKIWVFHLYITSSFFLSSRKFFFDNLKNGKSVNKLRFDTLIFDQLTPHLIF